MAPVVPLVTSVVGAVGTVVGSSTLATFGVSVAVGAAAGLVLRQGVPDIRDQGRAVPDVGADVPLQYVVGRTRTAGILAHRKTSGDNGGDGDKWQYANYVLSGAAIDAIEETYINNYEGTFSSFANSADGNEPTNLETQDAEDAGLPKHLNNSTYFNYHLGGASEPVDPMGLKYGDLTSNSRHQPFACVSERLDADEYRSQRPAITHLVRGVLCYDPREAGHDVDDPTTWEWSENPAIVAAWFLMQPWHRFFSPPSRIDWDAVTAAANVCDETVSDGQGGTEKRYIIGGVIKTNTDPVEQLVQIVMAMGGWFSSPRASGKWKITAGAAQTAVVDLTNADIVSRSAANLLWRKRDKRFHVVYGQFSDPEAAYGPNDYPAVYLHDRIAEEFPAYRTWLDANPSATEAEKRTQADSYSLVRKEHDLNLVTSPYQAQRLAYIVAKQSWEGKVWEGEMMDVAFALAPGDQVTLTYERFGWDEEPMFVSQRTISDNSITMRFESRPASVFTAGALQPHVTPSAPLSRRLPDDGATPVPDGGGSVTIEEAA